MLLNSWVNVAQRLAFTFNSAKRYHEEFEGYEYLLETGNAFNITGLICDK